MIHVCEVGPRDGLQNESTMLTVRQKLEMIAKLMEAGMRKIEAVSFVNPKVVPQMADAEEVMRRVPRGNGIIYAGLVLSPSGLKRALDSSVDVLHVVLAASDEFNRRNAKRTAEQSCRELTEVVRAGRQAGIPSVGIIATAFGCPFTGKVPLQRVLGFARALVEAGCGQITLADTTGMANPRQVQEAVAAFRSAFPATITLGLHFHNTRGLGLANVFAGYEAGVRHFDSSLAGLGGCPFAPRAVGNVCTEDMVNMFHEMGEPTGANLDALIQAARWMEQQIGRTLDGMVMKANAPR